MTAQTAATRQTASAHGDYWRKVYAAVSAALAARRSTLNFSDEERLLMDLGPAPGLDGAGEPHPAKELLAELADKGLSGCYYLSEWLAERHGQLQLESAIAGADSIEENSYGAQLSEARRRVLSRLASYFTGLPGIPLEVSESMRSGDLDRVALAAAVTALRKPTRKNFLRRHHMWALREQVLAKARARAGGQAALKLFDMLAEVYARDWRARFESFQTEAEHERALKQTSTALAAAQAQAKAASKEKSTVSVSDPAASALMSEARQMRMRGVLLRAVDGAGDETIIRPKSPRVTKSALAVFLRSAQSFDRALAELPPIVILPGGGRGTFAWETGCVLLALRPMVNLDDSAATAFAHFRMLDDRMNNAGALRAAYEKRFPGAVFHAEFPADYRAWLTRAAKGDAHAMSAQRRAFFRDMIGPDVSGPLLPPNLRNIGPQTMSAICRRLEKQVAGEGADANLHRRLAAIYWQQGNMEAAGLQFTAAIQAAPEDGETLFAAGMFLRAADDAEGAMDCFRWGKDRAKGSMWGLYCADALANQL